MSKHTPGPWRIGEHGSVVIDAQNFDSDEVTEFYGGHVVCESISTLADASLIAAAPELLKACEKLIAYDEAPASGVIDHNAIYENALKLARAAIVKAKGESNE